MKGPLRFTLHAEQRMLERGITKAEVEQVIRDPDVNAPANRPGSRRLTKTVGGRKITVIAEETAKYICIVSTWSG